MNSQKPEKAVLIAKAHLFDILAENVPDIINEIDEIDYGPFLESIMETTKEDKVLGAILTLVGADHYIDQYVSFGEWDDSEYNVPSAICRESIEASGEDTVKAHMALSQRSYEDEELWRNLIRAGSQIVFDEIVDSLVNSSVSSNGV